MITNNKRELQKKKEQKRQNKQKRKEIRRASASGAFEDMIAYVDVNGNITDTPQDLTSVEEVNVEDIVISTPTRVEEVIPRLSGRVDYFNADKGYGFIKDDNNRGQYFFHVSNAPELIAEGNRVTFDSEQDFKGMKAVSIEIINKDNKHQF